MLSFSTNWKGLDTTNYLHDSDNKNFSFPYVFFNFLRFIHFSVLTIFVVVYNNLFCFLKFSESAVTMLLILNSSTPFQVSIKIIMEFVLYILQL